MSTDVQPRYLEKRLSKTVLALKAARLMKGLSRKEAARLCGCSAVSFEQLENGRCNFTEDRIRRLVDGMGISWAQFLRLQLDPKRRLAEISEIKPKERSIDRKPRRNHYKIVTKEVRVIRILRKRKGVSQYQASRLCGYCRGGFGHIEVGRITLTKKRIEHILKSLGYVWEDYESLISSAVLREEVIEETIGLIHRLDDQALASVGNIIKSLIK